MCSSATDRQNKELQSKLASLLKKEAELIIPVALGEGGETGL